MNGPKLVFLFLLNSVGLLKLGLALDRTQVWEHKIGRFALNEWLGQSHPISFKSLLYNSFQSFFNMCMNDFLHPILKQKANTILFIKSILFSHENA